MLFGLTYFAHTQIDTFQISSTLLELEFEPEEIQMLKGSVRQRMSDYRAMHNLSLDNSISPALYFDVRPVGFEVTKDDHSKINWQLPEAKLPTEMDDLAFFSILELASLVKDRKISSVELTTFLLIGLKNTVTG
jgi:hypothetical protein